MNPELTLLYVHAEQIGYGRVGVYIHDELVKRGVTVYDDDGIEPGRASSAEVRRADDRRPPPAPTNAVSLIGVPTHARGGYQGQHRSILTMWESAMLPEGFRDTIHEFDLIMVPSWQNVEMFSEFHDNVVFVPLGIDPTLWNYSPPPKVGPTFDFLCAGRGERKGCDLAFKAFQTVFGHWWTAGDYRGPKDMPIPQLTMKSQRGHDSYFAPGIRHMPGKMTPEEEVALYRNSHCYIQPSRGEGFGLQPLQALAVGRPTILTNAHGHESYAHLGIGISAELSKAASFMAGDAGDWWEPDLEELCEAMWDCYSNYDAHIVQARFAAIDIRHHWTWANTTSQFLEHVGPEMTKPYTGSGEWKEMTHKLYKVITVRDHYSESAGMQRFFEKGRVYYDIADIKRILYDAGVLDPACIDPSDPGITEAQWDALPEYKATHSYCPTCQQQLNTQPTHADDILEAMQQDFEGQAAGIPG